MKPLLKVGAIVLGADLFFWAVSALLMHWAGHP